MTEDRLTAMLWHIAMERMAIFNTELAQPTHRQAAPEKRQWMRSIAEDRLSEYFDQVERVIALHPTPDTPGDRKRARA